MATEIRNAIITNTKLGEEHGCLTAQLVLDGGSWGCAFGGYCLDHWFAEIGEYTSTGGYGAIIELMKTIGVDSWEALKGQYVRVEIEENRVVKIGNVLSDQWYSFDDYFEKTKAKEQASNDENTL